MFRTVAKEELRVPGRVEYLGELRDFVTRIGKKYGFSERIVNAFKLSIDEAATNIIKHAYRDWEGDVTLRVMAKKNSLTMVLIDQGKYFDPRQVSSPDLQRYVDIGKKGGLGIFIMRRLLDNIDYRKSEEGNELWMVKNRDEEKKKKISISSIPLTLKMRYWLFSLAIFTLILGIVSLFNYINTKNQVLNSYINSGRTACESLEDFMIHYWQSPAVPLPSFEAFKYSGSMEAGVIDGALDGIQVLEESEEYKNMLKEIIVTNNKDMLIATSDSAKDDQKYTSTIRVEIPQDVKVLKEYEKSTAYLLNDENGDKVIDIVWPIQDDDNTDLARTHFRIDYSLVERDISRYLRGFIGEIFLVWIIVSAGLFLLIYVVMNPFKRLQEWVKRLSEPGGAEDVDIDSSTEIGAIAQAFSDVTEQLRKSQVNLAEQERLQQEMHIAKQIQQTLLPAEFPELEGYDISSFYAAAKDVGGDFFDFVEVDSDTLGVAVADVSGKGVPGAFVMTMIRTALRSEARGVKDAGEVLAKVNDFVVNDMKRGMFVTLFYVIIDSKRRRLNFASAGHNPMVLHRPSKNKTYYLNPRGFPIGISLPDKSLFKQSIQSDTIALAEDDILLVYTDGVTEAMNPKRRLFGEERFLRLIRERGKLSADDFIDNLKKELNTFTEGSEQNDDITLVAIKEKMSVERVEYDRAVRAYQAIQDGIGIKEACKEAGISTYSYYQKYKEKFDTEGIGVFTASEHVDQIEAKHLSIEEKNKIFDVIRRFPEYGAKRIAEELNTERYEYTEIPVSRLYEELVRSRLNTKELREAFVQRGGKKKRIKPPGTPMMTIDGKIILNRAQYEEPEDEEEEAPAAPPEPKEEEPEVKAEEHTEQEPEEELSDESEEVSEEPAGPNVFAMDKTTLLTAPLEDIFEKRSPGETDETDETEEPDEPSESHEPESAEEDVEDFDAVFGFVEEEAFGDDEDEEDFQFDDEQPTESEQRDKITIVSDDKLREFDQDEFDADDELGQIEKNIYDDNDDLDLLSQYKDDQVDDFDLDFSFADGENYDNLLDDNQEPSEEEAEASDENEEIFDLDQEFKDGDDDEFSFEQDDDFTFEQEETPEDEKDASEDLKESPDKDADDLFSFWTTDAESESQEDGKNGKQSGQVFSSDFDFADPFEEFLELEDEFGLIGEDGDVDQNVSDQLLSHDESFAASEDDDDQQNETDYDAFDLIGESKDHDQDDSQEDENLSLDQLISVSDDDEQFFSQHDEEFDRLIKDALSNDGKMQQFLSDNRSNNDKEEKQNEFIEQELKSAMVLYSESHFNEAIEKLNELADRFPNDHRAHSLLGNAYFREKNFKNASSEYERVIDLDPLNAKACENLAIAYAKQGELEKAIHHWERLLNITPNRMDVRLSIKRAKAFLQKY